FLCVFLCVILLDVVCCYVLIVLFFFFFFFSSRRRHTRFSRDWSSDVCSSDLFGDLRIFRGHRTGNRRAYPLDKVLIGIEGVGLLHFRIVIGRKVRRGVAVESGNLLPLRSREELHQLPGLLLVLGILVDSDHPPAQRRAGFLVPLRQR